MRLRGLRALIDLRILRGVSSLRHRRTKSLVCIGAALLAAAFIAVQSPARAVQSPTRPPPESKPAPPESKPAPPESKPAKPAPKPGAASTPTRASDPKVAETERARAAFGALKPAQKKELIDFLEFETSHSGSFQSSLIAWMLKQQDRDPLRWPALEAPPAFDPVVHAPAQPIARKPLDPASPAAKAAAETFLGSARSGATSADGSLHVYQPAFVYDYASGEVRHVVVRDEAERTFENALLGHPPKLDLVEALVERMLDDGSQKQRAVAFSHAYADRTGNVFPGVSLYDAWASGTAIEMPDVETLGIAHTLFDDWTTWKAPIPGQQQDPLYEKIGAEFVPLHRHRGLRHAIATTFARGSNSLQDGYEGYVDNLHALWEDCQSAPATLSDRLPAPKDWTEFLDAWRKHCLEQGQLYAAGQNRRVVLDSDARGVRATLLRVLEEYGAMAPKNPVPTPASGEKHDH